MNADASLFFIASLACSSVITIADLVPIISIKVVTLPVFEFTIDAELIPMPIAVSVRENSSLKYTIDSVGSMAAILASNSISGYEIS
ncbi:MAG: hypothetical protein BWY67_02009 [Bacteroidetes bacterium ADurb.Bin397]|nr:MAG: hypothetical protein BWY67_02009 [Bacteroidetes bacterium ADurb.Bin397]